MRKACRLIPLSQLERRELLQAWDQAAADETLFLSVHWLRCLMETAPKPEALSVLWDDDQSKPLALIGCGTVQRHRALRVRQWCINETADPVFDRICIEYNHLVGCQAKGFQAQDSAMAEGFLALMQAPRGPDELVLRNTDAAGAAAFREAAARAGWGIRTLSHTPAPTTDLCRLREAGGDFVATLGKNTRAAVRRAIRLYESEGPLRIERAANTEQALAWFDRMEALHIAAWQGRAAYHAFSNPGFGPFHKGLIAACHDLARVDVLRLSAGQSDVGFLYNFISNGRVMAYQSGFAPAPDNRWKPGLVSHCLAIAHYLENGQREYDFLGGLDRYKQSLSDGQRDMESLVAFAPKWWLRLENWIRQRRASGEAGT